MEALQKNKVITIALAGNPNSGKTSLFNIMTGARQRVGNWPGVTVEKKEGSLVVGEKLIQLIDLPGIYSLGAYTEDEEIAGNYILKDKPDVVVNIVDAACLERNLYLTLQILEMGGPVIIALNMADRAEKQGLDIDPQKMSSLLGVSVVPTIATKKAGVEKLVDVLSSVQLHSEADNIKIDYGEDVENEISRLEFLISFENKLAQKYSSRWIAVNLLEFEDFTLSMEELHNPSRIMEQVYISRKKLQQVLQNELEVEIIARRYAFISNLLNQCIVRKEPKKCIKYRLDRIVSHKVFGLPIFFVVMWVLFEAAFSMSRPVDKLLQVLLNAVENFLSKILIYWGADDFIVSMINDGIVRGIGVLFSFIPQIFILFFLISILEDSGYMARAAYVADRVMKTGGLHGKSFVCLVMGLGCNVPGIMATRTLQGKRDRLLTILLLPFMSCTARLPVYVLFAGAFFSGRQGFVIISLYILGMLGAILTGRLAGKLIFKEKASSYIMELPSYRLPSIKNVFFSMWEKGVTFIKKAGAIIFVTSVAVWLLANLPIGVVPASKESMIGRIGMLAAPLLEPAGFGNWQAAVALISGIFAKETVVSTLGIVYSNSGVGLGEILQSVFTPLSAYSFMVMTLFYIPCAATIATIKKETNSWLMTLFSITYSLLFGWILSVFIYQLGKILGL